jgi:L-threonine kinase
VVGGVLGLDTSASAIEDWLRQIEPTDGVMHPGAVAFEHRRVRLRAVLGPLPGLTVVAVDEGGQIDTVAFNQLPKPFSAPEKDEYAALLDRLTEAVRAGDPAAIGAVATRSAVLNQRLATKRSLDPMLAVSADAGALGVVCAHSGTMLGVLLADDDPAYPRRLAQVRAACARLSPRVCLFRSLPVNELELLDAV